MGLVICRSTTSDLIKMANKITTFFTEQASSSVRMLSSVNYLPPLDGDAVSSLANPLSTQSVQKNAKEHNKDGMYSSSTIQANSARKMLSENVCGNLKAFH